MPTHKKAGVYALVNIMNGKMCVGSTRHFDHRKYQHRYKLRTNTHPNAHLQSAANLYGVDIFDFVVLETVPNPFWLLAREQAWIRRLDSQNPEVGYNCADAWVIKQSPKHLKKPRTYRHYTLLSPDNEKVEVSRLKIFCDQRGLSYHSMFRAAQGEYVHRGWTRYDGGEDIKRKATVIHNRKYYTLLSPSGESVEICNLKKFCRENHLCYSKMCEAANGKRIYRGWYGANTPQEKVDALRAVKSVASQKRAQRMREYHANPKIKAQRSALMKNLWKSPKNRHAMTLAIRKAVQTQEHREKQRRRGLANPPRAKTYFLLSPSGERTEIYNLKKFCGENDLAYKQMHKVARGLHQQHRHWKRAA